MNYLELVNHVRICPSCSYENANITTVDGKKALIDLYQARLQRKQIYEYKIANTKMDVIKAWFQGLEYIKTIEVEEEKVRHMEKELTTKERALALRLFRLPAREREACYKVMHFMPHISLFNDT